MQRRPVMMTGPDGKDHACLPVLCFYIADLLEAGALVCVRNNVASIVPCIRCMSPAEKLGDPRHRAAPRRESQMMAVVESALRILATDAPGCIGAAEAICHPSSVWPVKVGPISLLLQHCIMPLCIVVTNNVFDVPVGSPSAHYLPVRMTLALLHRYNTSSCYTPPLSCIQHAPCSHAAILCYPSHLGVVGSHPL
jgi:hypothetical protein